MPAPVHAAVEDTDVPKSAQITPEEKVAQPCTSFGALNFLLHDQCVALIKASFVRTCKGPIDVRQNVPSEHTFYGPLVLGDERHRSSGALMPEDVPIALSYSWGTKGPFRGQSGNEDGTKDHPDPERFYLLKVQPVIGHMFRCKEYKDKTGKIFLFWVRYSC